MDETSKWIAGFVRLMRLPNVLIIVLTQLLLRYCVVLPWLDTGKTGTIAALPDFIVLIVVTALIAAGGYMINDYFDVKIDLINKPGQAVINRVVSARAAITGHMVLNAIALTLGAYLAWRVKSISFGLIFFLISGLLWIYSAKYKRTLLWGNLIISGLTAFVILIVLLFEFFRLRLDPLLFASVASELQEVAIVFAGYAMFAFLVSLVREIIKDIEDTEGDTKAGCKTLPIVAGVQTAKILAGSILVINMILLAFAQYKLWNQGDDAIAWYFLVTVQPVSVVFLMKLFKAHTKHDYHVLSVLCKLIMVTGVLSMLMIQLVNSLV